MTRPLRGSGVLFPVIVILEEVKVLEIGKDKEVLVENLSIHFPSLLAHAALNEVPLEKTVLKV